MIPAPKGKSRRIGYIRSIFEMLLIVYLEIKNVWFSSADESAAKGGLFIVIILQGL